MNNFSFEQASFVYLYLTSLEDPPGSTVGVTVFNLFEKKTRQNKTNAKGCKEWFGQK